MMWGTAWQVVEALRARGIKDGDFHPDTIFSVGGGTKGAKLPEDYKEKIFRFFNLTSDRVPNSYAMVEISGFCALIQPNDVRSEERRDGKVCLSTFRFRGSTYL